MPISGGSFPHQLAIMKILMGVDYRPTLILASSGGNIATYLTMASKWDLCGINRVVRSISSKLFVRSWLPNSLEWIPSWIPGIFMGSIYRPSQDAYSVFRSYFSPTDVKDIEVWVGAVNNKTGKLCLFGNRNEEQSVIKSRHYQSSLVNSEPLKYLNGDVDKICCASIASSSVPVITQCQVIDGNEYTDGGVKYASPLTPLQGELSRIGDIMKGIHIVYVSGYNTRDNLTPQEMKPNIFTNGVSATSHIAKGFVIHDRLTAYSLIARYGSINHAVLDDKKIREIWDLRSQCSSSLVEICPESRDVLDFTDFEGQDVLDMMEESSTHINIQVWWVGNPDLFYSVKL